MPKGTKLLKIQRNFVLIFPKMCLKIAQTVERNHPITSHCLGAMKYRMKGQWFRKPKVHSSNLAIDNFTLHGLWKTKNNWTGLGSVFKMALHIRFLWIMSWHVFWEIVFFKKIYGTFTAYFRFIFVIIDSAWDSNRGHMVVDADGSTSPIDF